MFSTGVNNKGVRDLASAREFLARGRRKDRRPLPGKATFLIETSEGAAVQYHATNIVEWSSEGVRVRFGGWHTPSTRAKIGLFTGFSVASAGKGYSSIGGVKVRDTALVRPDGSVESDYDAEQERAYKARRAVIKRFAERYADALFKGDVPPPSGGDCWCCSMFFDASGGDHIDSHIEEGYFVPSLLVAAAKSEPYLSRIVLPQVWREWPPTRDLSHNRRHIVKALRATIEAKCL